MILVNVFRVAEIKTMMGAYHKKAPVVISRALNRAIESARTNVVSKTREDYHVKASDVRNVIRLEKANPNKLKAIVRAKDTRRELASFKLSPGNPRPKKPPQVLRVAVKKDGLKDLPGAFVARGVSTEKIHVFKRVSMMRYPLRIKYGPAIPEMIGQPKVRIHVENEARVIFEKRLDHEIQRMLLGGSK